MGCLFGYAGVRGDGLAGRMAGTLSHRCAGGWERVSADMTGDDSGSIEIGRGIAPWSNRSQVSPPSGGQRPVFGYAGTVFKPDPFNTPICGSRDTDAFVESALAQFQSVTGAFVSAHAFSDTLILNRDPSGVKALYWTVTPRRILFASEIKALFADPDVRRKMRISALPEYLTFSYIPGEKTMFEDIFELQPGTMLVYREGRARLERYFEFEADEWTIDCAKSEEAYVKQVRSDLEKGVESACEAVNVLPGVFLSGGVDSSAVLAVLANLRPEQRIRSFSIHFGAKYANENQYVSLLANRYKTDHTWLEITPKGFLDRMRRIIWCLDDPIGDPITVPNFLLAETASRDVNAILNGEGGDPCFGGPKNIPMILSRIYGPFGESSNGWIERLYLQSYRKCYDDLDRILNPDVLDISGGVGALAGIVQPYFKTGAPRHFLNKLMAANIRLKGANLILPKVDKMTSANGVLALAPLFSKDIIKTSMACPPRLKLNGNIEKYVLKQAVADIVPREIIERPKSGMMVPVRFWLRGEMSRYARKVLSTKRLKQLGYFNIPYVKKLMKYDNREIRSSRYGLKLWMLITFMLWHEQMIEKRP